MNRVITTALLLTVVIGTAGCGAGKADEPAPAVLEQVESKNEIPGTWQTVSIGYDVDGELQPEYYVRFDSSQIVYGHMKDGDFVPDHSDEICSSEMTAAGGRRVQAQNARGVRYTYQTSEEDEGILEYYETWDEDAFPDNYSGGASLILCDAVSAETK